MPRLIDAEPYDKLLEQREKNLMEIDAPVVAGAVSGCRKLLANQPTIDAVEMPKGRPGDYLEWDNGAGFRQIYHIHAVMICEDCIRYDLEKFAPVVNHPGIVRIMSREEAEKEWRERCARERSREEPTLTACGSKMDGGADHVGKNNL